MDTSLAPATAAAPAAAGAVPGLDRLMALPLRSKLGLAAGVIALAALAVGGSVMSRQPDWKVLYASLGDKDGGQVIAALDQMNVPHRFTEGGGAIQVPADKVHEVRLRLASQGLPKGGAVGFELVENQKFGTTQFQERLNFQRGLEGELARSIMALAAVHNARVHLALPQQTAFLREQQKPSASVLLQLHPGRALERDQVAGIVHLVASSVPDLNPKAVSVVDQSGALLSATGGDAPNGLDAGQLRHVRETEQLLASRVLAIVEPLVGAGNVKAQVTADLDFSQTESTAETYAPNQGQAPAAVRSQHLSETPGAGSQGPGGVPGALTNQPAAAAPSPINGAPQALSAGAAGGAGGGGNKRDAVTNYEVDKTVKVTRAATGTVKRLSAAIVINHVGVAGPDGKVAAKALAPEQMEQINALVREAIGFSKDRGDSVNVVNAAFNQPQLPAPVELPLWRQPETQALARSLAPWIALPLLALVVLFGLVRPALRAGRKADAQAVGGAPGRLVEATVRDAIELDAAGLATGGAAGGQPAGALPGAEGASDVPLLPTAQAAAQQTRARQLDHIRQLAKQNPATIANVVRNWSSQPAS